MLNRYLELSIVMVLIYGLTALRAQTEKAAITIESINKGLVLHLPFDLDETGVNRVSDVSGMGNNGKATGVRWIANGKKGGAYEFDTDGDQIVIPNNASLNPKQMTLSAWIKTSVICGYWQRIFDKSYSQGYAFSIAANWRGNLWDGQANLEIGPGTHFSVSKTMLSDGEWHHVVATFDGTEQIIFVDGRPDCLPLQWDSTGQIGSTDFDLVIGCNRSNLDEPDLGKSFQGLIDEPMMWNRALSLEEVAFLYKLQVGNAEKQGLETKISSQSGCKKGKPDLKLLRNVIHLSHCDIRLHIKEDVTVFVDPVEWPIDKDVVTSEMVRPDLILITHSHYDHFQPTILKEYLHLNPKAIIAGPTDVVTRAKEKGIEVMEIKPGKNYTMAGIEFNTVPAYIMSNDSHPKSMGWVGYILQLDGASYYITGDTEPVPEMEDLDVDVVFTLLAACGGSLGSALRIVELTGAHIVVPVHTNGQVRAINQFFSRLPSEVYGQYYLNGQLVLAP